MGWWTSRRVGVLGLVLAALLGAGLVSAAPVRTGDGLSGQADKTALTSLQLDGRALPGVTVRTLLLDPRTGQPLNAGFTVTGDWRVAGNLLTLSGEVRAEGQEDTVADLVVRLEGLSLQLSTMGEDPLLLPRKLLGKLPLVSLRAGNDDCLALALPPRRLASFDFRASEGAVELRYRFGFTKTARPELQMRAPFTCVLYRTDPRWHFRSALQRYYAAFPSAFEAFEKRQGGWFFAAETPDLPNPQHFFYHEGGPGGWEADHARGMGTFPYRESSSYTISLPGNVPPKDYAEARQQFDKLDQQITPTAWTPQQSFTVDTVVVHEGKRSLLADPGTSRSWVGAVQTITVEPPTDRPLKISAFSRAEGVDGAPGADYSLYVDVQYTDGSYLFGQTAVFQTGTHDWQQAEWLIRPTKPVATLRVFCLLRNHACKAWFDDIHVGPADAPDVNWVRNPSFETDAKRSDLQYIRDNVAENSRGEWVFAITDNLSADVGPATPMNLLRFTLNPDPDLPTSDEHPAVGTREVKYYENMLRSLPGVDGAYIDSVSAWIYGVLNGRRDQWQANDHPFTYDPSNVKVVAAGRWAMVKYLERLQERLHPLGKSVFTNIHVNLEAFPLYLVSDVPGIESSLFNDEDAMFFYRASSYQKPLVLLNFMNLHGLDQRDTAVKYHVNAAQWGEFPSTGRFVQRAYREYGDVTHAWVPAIKELSAAGWQPVPLAAGARVERFGQQGAVYYTIRAPQTPAEEKLTIEPEAVQQLGRDLVAYDAQTLAPVPLQRQGRQWVLPLEHGASELQIVRISSPAQVAPWLLARARQHALQAGRVRGEESLTPQIRALQQALAAAPPAKPSVWLATARQRLTAALTSVPGATPPGAPDDLFALSSRRELQQAEEALAALAATLLKAEASLEGPRLAYPGETLTLRAKYAAPGGTRLRLDRIEAQPEGSLELTSAPSPTGLQLTGKGPGVARVRADFTLPAGPGLAPWRLQRLASVYVRPAATLTVHEQGSTDQQRSYKVSVQRQGEAHLQLQVIATPAAPVSTPLVQLAQGQQEATVTLTRVPDGVRRALHIEAVRAGNVLAQTDLDFGDEPPVPADDLALARLGATVTVDSNHSGYTPVGLTNGQITAEGLHWSEAAWASLDSGKEHWVEVVFAKPASISRVGIYWARDAGRTYNSQQYRIVGLTPTGKVVLAEGKEPGERTYSGHSFAPVVLRGIRLEQPAGGGPAARPGIMWVRELVAAP